MKHLVFAYGTLRDPVVRNTVIGRKVHTKTDFLQGYCMEEIFLDGKTYPIINKSVVSKNPVRGEVFEVFTNELRLIDIYESEAYKREKVILASGREAWVYVKP